MQSEKACFAYEFQNTFGVRASKQDYRKGRARNQHKALGKWLN